MTTPNEMRSASEWMEGWSLNPGLKCWDINPSDIHAIQADALAWAAGQIEGSHSMQEAVLRLSIKHRELTKAKK